MEEEIKTLRQVAILEKDGKFAAIGLMITEGGTLLTQAAGDWQTAQAAASPMYSPEVGRQKFEGSLDTSEKNGWRVRWIGEENRG